MLILHQPSAISQQTVIKVENHLYFEQLFCSIAQNDPDRHKSHHISVIRQLSEFPKTAEYNGKKGLTAPRYAASVTHPCDSPGEAVSRPGNEGLNREG